MADSAAKRLDVDGDCLDDAHHGRKQGAAQSGEPFAQSEEPALPDAPTVELSPPTDLGEASVNPDAAEPSDDQPISPSGPPEATSRRSQDPEPSDVPIPPDALNAASALISRDSQNRDPDEKPEALGLGPGYAIVRALAGDRIPDGPLGSDTVPASVLSLPIAMAMDAFVHHVKKCRDAHRCTYVPRSLEMYRRMRPDAIRKAKDQVHKVLWTHPTNELVESVRKQILESNVDLASDLSEGRLLTEEKLAEHLKNPGLLAAVIWAAEFKGLGAEPIFRSLVPLLAEPPRASVIDEPARDDQVRSLKAKFRKAVRAWKRAKRTGEQASHDLQVKERAFERLKREFDDVQEKHERAAAERDQLASRLQAANVSIHNLQESLTKSTKINNDLRRDRSQLQREQNELELARSDLARQLAIERRSIEQLRLQIAAAPSGAEAVREFLHNEEERIRITRTISAGGERERAEEAWRVHGKLERAFLEAYPEFRKPRPATIAPKTSLGLVALGGSNEVGRSCYLIELGKHRILVDCGIRPDTREDSYPNIDSLDRPDALVLTHAHTDHIGWVPALVRRFPDLSIYCSEATAALLPVMLEDCYQHYMRKIEAERKRRHYIANARPVQEAYDAHDVHAVSKLVISCIFNQKEPLPFGGISLRFCPAGHVLGAASVLIQDLSGPRVFFSGDFASFPQLTIPAADWPNDIGDVDLLVLESTYGGRPPHKPLQSSRTELIDFARRTLEGNGSVILASFGLGRAQELLKLIAAAQDDGELPPVTVYVDGMIKRINPIYRKWASFEISAQRFYEVSGDTDRQDVAAVAQTRPSIIVTTSGMLTGGPVLHYAKHLLGNPQNRIVLTGYQDEGAPSRVLKETAIGRRVVVGEDENGHKVEFEAAMPAKEIGLSAHADQPGLLEYAAKLRPRHVALVHGEPAGQEALRHQLLKNHRRCAIVCGPERLSVL